MTKRTNAINTMMMEMCMCGMCMIFALIFPMCSPFQE